MLPWDNIVYKYWCMYERNSDNFVYGTKCHIPFKSVDRLKVIDIKSDIYYEGITFENVCFDSLKIQRVCFHECAFYNCIFENVEFVQRNYKDEMYSQGFSKCDFNNCRFNRCKLTNVFFSMMNFSQIVFEDCNINDTLFHRCGFQMVMLQGNTTIGNSMIFSPSRYFDISLGGEAQKIKIDGRCIVGSFAYNDFVNFHTKEEIKHYKLFKDEIYRNAALTYNLFEQLRQLNNISEPKNKDIQPYYQYQKATTRSKRFFKRIPYIISEVSFGYGECPFRSLMSIAIIIFLFANIYLFTGFSSGESAFIKHDFDGSLISTRTFGDWLKSLYFSFFTMISVGQGTPTPQGSLSYFLSCVELVMGAIYMALFTSTLFRKYTK